MNWIHNFGIAQMRLYTVSSDQIMWPRYYNKFLALELYSNYNNHSVIMYLISYLYVDIERQYYLYNKNKIYYI